MGGVVTHGEHALFFLEVVKKKFIFLTITIVYGLGPMVYGRHVGRGASWGFIGEWLAPRSEWSTSKWILKGS